MLRPVLPQDVSSAARALLVIPKSERAVQCCRMFDLADLAAVHLRNYNRLHPDWGNGSLDAVARRMGLAAEPFWDDAAYLHCLLLVLKELKQRLVPD